MAWFYSAVKKQIAHNYSKGKMVRPFKGLILHIQEGTEAGTFGWFNLTVEERQAVFDADWEKKGKKGKKLTAYASSAHFGNPKSGPLDQFLNTDDQAWAQGTGNGSWISVENEGFSGDSLTASQIDNLVRLLVWLNVTESVPLQLADTTEGSGLGTHSMGGAAWGNHTSCPGDKIIAQRQEIIDAAIKMVDDIRKIVPDVISGAG